MRGLVGRAGFPRASLPVEQPVGRRHVHAFPPHVAVGRHRDVGEDRVVLDHLHRVQIRFRAGARRDAEVAVLGIDRPQAAVGADAHPRDIVADGEDLPALELRRRREHREVGLAACARKRGGDIGGLAVGTLQAEDQHVLGEPAFVAAEHARDSKRETFLAEQRVAAVAAADRDDRVVLREVANQAALGIQIERAMNSAVEVVGVAKLLERGRAHPRHDSHVQHDVDAVGELDADLRERRAERAHHVRHHVHRAPAHRAVEPSAQLGVSLGGLGPVVGGAGVDFVRRADEGQLLGARDVVGIRAMQVAAGPFVLVELDENSRGDRLFGEAILSPLRSRRTTRSRRGG